MSQAQQLANLSQAYSAGALAMQNRIINGDFRVTQRPFANNTIPHDTLYWTADRHYVWSGVANTTFDASWATGNFPHSLHVMGGASNSTVNIGTRIEAGDIEDCANQVVTYSGWLYSDNGIAPAVSFGVPTSRDAWSGAVNAISGFPTALPMPSGWTAFQISLTLPDTAKYGLQVEIQFGAVGAGKNVALTGLQLVPGRFALPFSRRSLALEILLAQRYYEVTWLGSFLVYNQSVTAGLCTIPFQTPKFRIPTFSFSSVGAFVNENGVGNITGFTSDRMELKHCQALIQGTGGAAAGTCSRLLASGNGPCWFAFNAETA